MKRLRLALPLGTDRTLRSPEKCCSSRGGRFPLQLRPGGDSAFTVGGKNALSRETRDTFAWPRMAHAVPSCQEGGAFTAEMLLFSTQPTQRAQPAAAEVGGGAPLPLAGESLPLQRPGTALPGRDSAGCTVQGGGSPWFSVGNRCRPQLPCCPEDGSSFSQMEWEHRVCIAWRTAERKPLSRESATHGPASATRGLPPGRTTLRLER